MTLDAEEIRRLLELVARSGAQIAYTEQDQALIWRLREELESFRVANPNKEPPLEYDL